MVFPPPLGAATFALVAASVIRGGNFVGCMNSRDKLISSRPPIVLIFAILFAALAVGYGQYSGPSAWGYDHVIRMNSDRGAHDIADCLIHYSEGDSKKSMESLRISTVYGPDIGNMVLRSEDKSTFISIGGGIYNGRQISVIVRMRSTKDGRIMEWVRRCT